MKKKNNVVDLSSQEAFNKTFTPLFDEIANAIRPKTAKETHMSFKHRKKPKLTAKKVNPMKCICCGKEIELYNVVIDSKSHPEQAMWFSGLVDNMAAGFGSSYDGMVFYVGICDDCLTKKINDGVVIYSHDYM